MAELPAVNAGVREFESLFRINRKTYSKISHNFAKIDTMNAFSVIYAGVLELVDRHV